MFLLRNATSLQREATENARAFLIKQLPMPHDAFVTFVKQSGFICNRGECHYTKARPPIPCAPTLRVSIEMLVGENKEGMVSESDLDIAAMIIEDGPDNRGCFPL